MFSEAPGKAGVMAVLLNVLFRFSLFYYVIEPVSSEDDTRGSLESEFKQRFQFVIALIFVDISFLIAIKLQFPNIKFECI